jgi:hypothetical protein
VLLLRDLPGHADASCGSIEARGRSSHPAGTRPPAPSGCKSRPVPQLQEPELDRQAATRYTSTASRPAESLRTTAAVTKIIELVWQERSAGSQDSRREGTHQ